MNDEKFTKGPWRVRDGSYCEIETQSGDLVARSLYNSKSGNKYSRGRIDKNNLERASNTILLAHAPQLFHDLNVAVVKLCVPCLFLNNMDISMAGETCPFELMKCHAQQWIKTLQCARGEAVLEIPVKREDLRLKIQQLEQKIKELENASSKETL